MRGADAVLLMAGSGSRMGVGEKKQFLPLLGKPLFYYSLRSLLESPRIERICLVVSRGDEERTQELLSSLFPSPGGKELLFSPGGAERCLSVRNALLRLYPERFFSEGSQTEAPLVLIQDSARPFLKEKFIEDSLLAAEKFGAAVLSVPVKDTIKRADPEGFVRESPDRRSLWQVQTPQSFRAGELCRAYGRMSRELSPERAKSITDDGMVMELFSSLPVKLVEGSYRNIKITTAEDLEIAKLFFHLELDAKKQIG